MTIKTARAQAIQGCFLRWRDVRTRYRPEAAGVELGENHFRAGKVFFEDCAVAADALPGVTVAATRAGLAEAAGNFGGDRVFSRRRRSVQNLERIDLGEKRQTGQHFRVKVRRFLSPAGEVVGVSPMAEGVGRDQEGPGFGRQLAQAGEAVDAREETRQPDGDNVAELRRERGGTLRCAPR